MGVVLKLKRGGFLGVDFEIKEGRRVRKSKN